MRHHRLRDFALFTCLTGVVVGLAGSRANLAGASLITAKSPSAHPAMAKGKRHTGHHADAGGWDSCESINPNAKPDLNLLTRRSDGTFPLLATESQALIDNAATICFLDSQDDKGPLGGPEWQHEDKVMATVGGLQLLRVRPSSTVHNADPEKITEKNKGYFVADYLNAGTVKLKAFGVEIEPNHSVLLWIGTDENGKAYSAVIDAGKFPESTADGVHATATVLQFGKLCSRTLAQEHKRANAFARFAEPPHPYQSTTCPLPPAGHVGGNHRFPDGNWVECTPGCCIVTGITARAQETH